MAKTLAPIPRYRIVIRNDTDWRGYKEIARPVFDRTITGERTSRLSRDPVAKSIQFLKEKPHG